VATTKVITVRQPKVDRSFRNGDIVVDHSEYIGDINGSTTFTANAFAINPGLYSSFPWLSQLAQFYESYRFESLRFEFQTEANTMSVGTVMAASDYDASDSAPTSKVQMASYRGFVRSAPWKGFTNVCLKEDLSKQKTYFVRNGMLAANRDVKLYDVGNFFIATDKQADTTVVGELYVHYRVGFMTPQLGAAGLGSALSARINWTGATIAVVGNSNAPLVPSGSSAVGAGAVVTALAPYQALVSYSSVGVGLTAFDTAASTCTIQSNTTAINSAGTTGIYTAQLSFNPGQTFAIAPVGTSAASAIMQLGQFDTLGI
jgi:hypothetical protein